MDDEWMAALLQTLTQMDEEHALDEILHLLSHHDTRSTISYLATNPTPTLDELTDVIAGHTATKTDTIITPQQYDRIRIRLYHATLPQLENAGLIHFNTDTKTIQDSHIPEGISDLLVDLP